MAPNPAVGRLTLFQLSIGHLTALKNCQGGMKCRSSSRNMKLALRRF
jgi:hypothetical protein